jgi:hypothetical protein
MTLAQEEFAHAEDSLLLRQIKEQQWGNVRVMVGTEEGKAMTRRPDVYGNVPLHAAIGFRAPEHVILTILTEYPEATRVHGTDEWLPLHVAAMWGVSSQVMEALIRQYPEALDDGGQASIKGRTPRHFSTRFAHNKEALERPTSEWIQLIQNETKNTTSTS